MTTPISESARKCAEDIEWFYDSALDNECSCYSRPGDSCAYCNAWASAEPKTAEQIQLAINTEKAPLEQRIKELEAKSDSWESTCRVMVESKLPCGHSNDCAYDKDGGTTFARSGCVWCERDSLKQQLEDDNRNLGLTLQGKPTEESYRGIAKEVERKFKQLRCMEK